MTTGDHPYVDWWKLVGRLIVTACIGSMLWLMFGCAQRGESDKSIAKLNEMIEQPAEGPAARGGDAPPVTDDYGLANVADYCIYGGSALIGIGILLGVLSFWLGTQKLAVRTVIGGCVLLLIGAFVNYLIPYLWYIFTAVAGLIAIGAAWWGITHSRKLYRDLTKQRIATALAALHADRMEAANTDDEVQLAKLDSITEQARAGVFTLIEEIRGKTPPTI